MSHGRKIGLLLAALALCVNAVEGSGPHPDRFDRSAALKRLAELTSARSYFNASAELSRLRQKYPDDAAVLLAAARLHRDMGLVTSAENEYLMALQRQPDLAEACLALSNIYLQKLDVRNALNYAHRAFNLRPTTQTRLALVSALVGAGKLGEANSELAQLLKSDGTNAQVQYMAYELSLSMNRNSEALRYLEAAVTSSPTNIPWLLELSDLYKDSGDYPYARSTLEHVLSLDPNSADALNKLAIVYEFYLHDYEKATAQYRKILSLDPDSVTALAGLDRCRMKENDIAGALKFQLRAMLSYLSSLLGKAQTE